MKRIEKNPILDHSAESLREAKIAHRLNSEQSAEDKAVNQDKFEGRAKKKDFLLPKTVSDNTRYISANRRALMEKIHETYFQKQPESLLYLGAGADVEHPFLATQAKKMVFVDTQEPDKRLFGDKLLSLTGENPEITMLNPKTLEFSLEHPTGGQTKSIEYNQSSYSSYFADHPKVQHDVIFDKDSWLMDNPKDLNKAIASLKEGGRWISNAFAGVAAFERLFEAAGLKRITDRISTDPTYETPFGNIGNVEVLEKTKNYNEAALSQAFETWGQLKKIKSNAIDDGVPIRDKEDFEDFIDLIDDQIDLQINHIQANENLRPETRRIMITDLNNMRVQWKEESEKLKDF